MNSDVKPSLSNGKSARVITPCCTSRNRCLRKTVKNAPGHAQVLLVIDREMLSLQGRGCGMRFV